MTDVVDSTRLTERLGDAVMAELWSVHDRVARDLLVRWRGREIDKADGMLTLFESVADAVAYAAALNRDLAGRADRLQVRAAIHVGPIELRHNEAADVARGAKPLEVSGLALATAARTMSIALGGQTLLTAEAHAELGPASTSLHSHGYWHFEGISEPFELFEYADHPQRGFCSPNENAKAWRVVRQGDYWRPLSLVTHSLPVERDTFVGQRDALVTIDKTMEDGIRLLSVIGIGGGGKTRLVKHWAWNSLHRYPGGVWFCDLSEARTLDGIAVGVAHGLGVALAHADPIAQLGHAIAGRGRCLVILDNFEQVAEHARASLGTWIERTRSAQFIATSREVLGIEGENILQLSPLSRKDGVALFRQRAASARLQPMQEDDSVEAIEELVSFLDGLPLAIELAAARVRVMTPRAMVERIGNRFDLASARSGRQGRQLTLRAAFDWSWELLMTSERCALAMLSVFSGGFTLASAHAVLGDEGGAPSSALEVIHGLVDKSFVRIASDERFDLLATVREYAAHRLLDAHDLAGGTRLSDVARARHWRFFAGIDGSAASDRRELGNLIAACRAALEAGEGHAAAACLASAWPALRLVGPYRVALELARQVAAVTNLSDEDLARVHWVAGDAAQLLGDSASAHAALECGLACADRAHSAPTAARLRISLGVQQVLDGDLDRARENLEQAHSLALALGDEELRMQCLNALGLQADHQSRLLDARGFYEASLLLARSVGDRRMEGGLLGNLGGVLYDLGSLEDAQTRFEMALEAATELGDRRWEGNARCNLGLLHQERGRFEAARGELSTALEIARQMGHVRLEYTVQCNLGILLTSTDEFDRAGEHFALAVDAAVAASDRRAEGQFRGRLALNSARRGLIDDARALLDVAEALLRGLKDDLSYALVVCDRAEVEIHAKSLAAALEAHDEARGIAARLNCSSDSELCRRLDGIQRLLVEASERSINS